MTTSEKQRQQQAELQKKLWSIANDLRGNMDANEFKNYILGLIFYRFLSEKVEETSGRLLSEDNISYQEAMNNDDYRPIVEKELIQRIGFVIEPENLFSNLKAKIENQTFEIEDLSNAIKNVENSTRGHESEDDFIHLFDDMDLNSSRLGNTNAARTKLIAKVMMNISTLPFVHSDLEIDMLGDAYEASNLRPVQVKSRRILYTSTSIDDTRKDCYRWQRRLKKCV